MLVQYDEDNSKYVYGFTFKDSNGNAMYPIVQSRIDSKGKDIQPGLSLSRPTTGKVTRVTEIDNWSGFDVNSSTDLVVLVAESDGKVGNGETTCTLVQKGDNYEEVEVEKNNNSRDVDPPTNEDETPDDEEKDEMIEEEKAEYEKYLSETTAYAIYSENDQTLTFVRSKEKINVGDVSEGITVTKVYTGFEKNL